MNRHDRRATKAKREADLRQGVDRAIAVAVRAQKGVSNVLW
jgi:hypothetical protein